MKTNPDFILREIAGEHILVPCGEAARRFNGLITLNETAAFIWKHVDTAPDADALAALVEEHFEVEPEVARRDVSGLFKELAMAGLLTRD